jgi:hypothetical protein
MKTGRWPHFTFATCEFSFSLHDDKKHLTCHRGHFLYWNGCRRNMESTDRLEGPKISSLKPRQTDDSKIRWLRKPKKQISLKSSTRRVPTMSFLKSDMNSNGYIVQKTVPILNLNLAKSGFKSLLWFPAPSPWVWERQRQRQYLPLECSNLCFFRVSEGVFYPLDQPVIKHRRGVRSEKKFDNLAM